MKQTNQQKVCEYQCGAHEHLNHKLDSSGGDIKPLAIWIALDSRIKEHKIHSYTLNCTNDYDDAPYQTWEYTIKAIIIHDGKKNSIQKLST